MCIRDSFIIDHVLAAGAVTTLAGTPGAGKTNLILRFCKAILAGDESVLGFAVSVPADFKIAYLTQEAGWTFVPAMQAAGIRTGELYVAQLHRNFETSWQDSMRDAAAVLSGNGLLVVDTVLDWSGAEDENDSATMTKVYKHMSGVAGNGVSVLATTHTRKDFDASSDDVTDIAAVRGSGAVSASSSVVLLYKKPQETSLRNDDVRYFKIGRSRFGIPGEGSFYARLNDKGELNRMGKCDLMRSKTRGGEEKVFEAIAEIEGNGEQATIALIGKVAGVRRTDAKTALDALEDAERVSHIGKGVKGDPKVYETL